MKNNNKEGVKMKIIEESNHRLVVRLASLPFRISSTEIVIDRAKSDMTIYTRDYYFLKHHQHIHLADIKDIIVKNRAYMTAGGPEIIWSVSLLLHSGKQVVIQENRDLQSLKDLASYIKEYVKATGFEEVNLIDRSPERQRTFQSNGYRYGIGGRRR